MHENDRAALLAAINEAATNMGKKGVSGAGKVGNLSAANTALLQGSRVNANVARDLVSHATSASRVADMADFMAA